MNRSAHVVSADLKRPAPRPLRWMRRHPVVVDVAVATLACLPLGLALFFRAEAADWWGYPLLALTAAALLARRRAPMTVLVVVALACAFSPIVQPGFGTPTPPYAVALYTVASRQRTSRAWIGFGLGIAASVLATIPYSISGITPPQVGAFDPVTMGALVLGLVVRHRREQELRLVELVNQRIENAALVERARISAEMHDIVAHSLSVIVSLANGAASIRERHPAKADAAVEQIAEVSREALDDMHRALHLLRDADAGLDENLHRSGDNLPTIDELAERFRAAGLPVAVTRSGDPLPEDAGVRQSIYRVVQESLTNALRHADAPTQARVGICHGGGRITVTVEDDGRAAQGPREPGHGLVGIAERAAALGGHAELGPRPGGGWRNIVTLRGADVEAEDV